jgi:hypothetical protein
VCGPSGALPIAGAPKESPIMSLSVDPYLLAEDDPPCDGPCWCHEGADAHEYDEDGGEG